MACKRDRSSASASAGIRRVTAWMRRLKVSMAAPQATSSSAKLAYSSSRLASVGTRSALAILTVDSEPPLDSGS